MIMSNNGKKRSSRERREIRETAPEKAQKKSRGERDSDGDKDQREDGAVTEPELLDPVAEARKALEMFEEVSGETIVHTIPKIDANTNAKVGELNDRDTGHIRRSHKNANGSSTEMIYDRRKLDVLNNGAPNEERRKDQARQKEEEKARQRKRIEDGEARRREFRPKIVGLQDSNCLL